MENIDEMENRVIRTLMDNVRAAPTAAVDYARPNAPQRWFKTYADVSAAGDLTIRRDEIDPWSIYGKREPDPRELQAQHDSIVTQAREDGAKAERERIAQKLEALQPMEQPYTRRDWALEQRGEKAMYEKIMKALVRAGQGERWTLKRSGR